MHPEVFAAFERLCRRRGLGAGRVLEIGAVPSDDTLLCLPALAAATQKLGVNLAPPARFRDVEIRQGNANALPDLVDASFDLILSNATLEHDPRFWLTLVEMRRLLAPGGHLVIGVPGYDGPGPAGGRWRRLRRRLARLPFSRGRYRFLEGAALTLLFHGFPDDYYRFSPSAVSQVFLEGLEATEIERVMEPPRFIGCGRKPAA